MVAMRSCSGCGQDLPKSEYSSNQWSKKKDTTTGKNISKCKGCVVKDHNDTDAIASNNNLSAGLEHLSINKNTTTTNSSKYAAANEKAKEVLDATSKITCASCGDSNSCVSKQICTGCRAARYCNKTCQTGHRKTHKQLCKFIQSRRKDGEWEDEDNSLICHDCSEIFTCQSQLMYHTQHRIACSPFGDPFEGNVNSGEEEEETLNEILRDIEVCEVMMLNDDVDDLQSFEQLDDQKTHWTLCYNREEQLEQIRMEKLYAEWRKQDEIETHNVDNDNMNCVLCKDAMGMEGECDYVGPPHVEGYYRVNRFFCCGARYCPKEKHQDELLPTICPTCDMLLLTSENATKDNLLRHAEDGKTWAQLELAERYRKGHPSILDDAMRDQSDHNENQNYHQNEAIQWARKAADKGNVLAIIFLARICHGGGIRQESKHGDSWSSFYDIPERTMLMKRAADTGDSQSTLAYIRQAEMFDESSSQVLKYWNLLAYDTDDEKVLGNAFRKLAEDCEQSGGPDERTLFLYEQGALNGDASSMARFSYCLNQQSVKRFGSYKFPKYSQLPKMYHWAKKAADAQCSEGITLLEKIETYIEKDKCACLQFDLCKSASRNNSRGKKNKRGGSQETIMIPCKRCGTVYFCSESCRLAFDTIAGHRKDCCDCSYCKVKGPFMGFADWKRHGPSHD
mmetsp:Transcript_42024/g.75739  ORF Transcript_42024/g.75739 Transcript_42024/m.75739 type:complete len:679 (-) Transcript_42024:14-2050(-)